MKRLSGKVCNAAYATLANITQTSISWVMFDYTTTNRSVWSTSVGGLAESVN